MARPLTPEAAATLRARFEEVKKLIEQRQQVQLELVNRLAKAIETKLKTVPGLPPVALTPTTSKQQPPAVKRSSSVAAAPDPKRPKLDFDADRKIQDPIWRMCANVLDYLTKKKNASVFNRPVDVARDGCPDYYKFILHPMDLGTVKTKLRERRYADPREFAADVRLVWSNCRIYNQINTPVRSWGDQLSDDFERKWAEQGIEQRWDELMLQRDPQAVPLERRIATSARQLVQRVNSIHVLPEVDPSRAMTAVEKRKLSIALSELQGDQLAEVVNIIADNLKDMSADDDEEIELDVDQLDNSTLWRLREYCDAVANRAAVKAGGAPVKAAPPAAAAAQQQQQHHASAQAPAAAAQRPTHGNGKAPGVKAPARTESGSESDRYSAEQDVKGSNMVEQPQSQPNFVKNQRTALPVDESATAPKDKSAIATDKKSNKDVVLNASAWQAAEEDPAEGGGEAAAEAAGGGEEEGDDLWDSFRSVAERERQQKAEEEKRRKELEAERERERLRAVAEARQAQEEEDRKMREAEEAAAAEARRQKDEARQKELEELQMQANTAQVYQPPDAKAFAQTFEAGGTDIRDLGLMYKHDDDADDVNFDD